MARATFQVRYRSELVIRESDGRTLFLIAIYHRERLLNLVVAETPDGDS
jgi:hypothetical protein